EQLARRAGDAEGGVVEKRQLAVRMQETSKKVRHALDALARPRRRVVVGRTQEGQDLEVVGEHERVGDGVPRAMPTVFVDLLAQLAPEERRAGVEPAPGFEPIEEASRQEEGSAGRP